MSANDTLPLGVKVEEVEDVASGGEDEIDDTEE